MGKSLFTGILIYLVTCSLTSNFELYAQEILSLDSLWSGTYSAARMESIRSLKDGQSYTLLEENLQKNGNQIDPECLSLFESLHQYH